LCCSSLCPTEGIVRVGLKDMTGGRLTRILVHWLNAAARRYKNQKEFPEHLRLGSRGEEAAYFELRKLGYVMVGRNFRTPRCHGEIDLIGWDGNVLCFIEVKTRTSRDVKTAEAAVDRYKRRELAEVAREYLRKVPPSCQWRFDIVSVYYDGRGSRPQIELFRNASLAA
jgi:putative endonuclease